MADKPEAPKPAQQIHSLAKKKLQGLAPAAQLSLDLAMPAALPKAGPFKLGAAFLTGMAMGMAAADERPPAESVHARMSLGDDDSESRGRDCDQQDHDREHSR